MAIYQKFLSNIVKCTYGGVYTFMNFILFLLRLEVNNYLQDYFLLIIIFIFQLNYYYILYFNINQFFIFLKKKKKKNFSFMDKNCQTLLFYNIYKVYINGLDTC